MPKVDDKGRIVLPKEVRERLDLTPGTEVEVRADAGRAIVAPEDDPERIIRQLDDLVASAAPKREPPATGGDLHPIARKHAERIRNGVEGGAGYDE